eukprot:scaffold50114_cov54-Attheya_sp.AAC.1
MVWGCNPKTMIVPERNRAKPGWHKQPASGTSSRVQTASQFQSPVELAKGKQNNSNPFVPNMPHEKKRGKVHRSLMRPAAWMDLHPFSPTLHKWEKGVPVDCGEDWSRETIGLAIAKGPHASALTPEARKLVLEDVVYQVEAGFSRIITWESIKENPPA